jgi:eukaryotic-like serine/threonine-protein kinase
VAAGLSWEGVDVIGTRFGDGLQVLREIGKGALARVYLVSDGRVVKAVKLFPPDHRDRADRELSIGRGLDHPHVNPVEAGVELGGYPGVLMPFAPGERLGRRLARSDDRNGFLQTMRGVLEGLRYLHERGVVHRDVKPENILVERSGHARLVDFDLSVRVDEVPSRPTLAGTIAYLSPEQARGRPVTPGSDLYAVGIILYRGLTGQVPFTGTVAEVIGAHRDDAPAPASTIDAALAPFDPLLERLLAKDPGARFRSAAEVLDALGRFPDDIATPPRPGG